MRNYVVLGIVGVVLAVVISASSSFGALAMPHIEMEELTPPELLAICPTGELVLAALLIRDDEAVGMAIMTELPNEELSPIIAYLERDPASGSFRAWVRGELMTRDEFIRRFPHPCDVIGTSA